jgi:hypothetical protein
MLSRLWLWWWRWGLAAALLLLLLLLLLEEEEVEVETHWRALLALSLLLPRRLRRCTTSSPALRVVVGDDEEWTLLHPCAAARPCCRGRVGAVPRARETANSMRQNVS